MGQGRSSSATAQQIYQAMRSLRGTDLDKIEEDEGSLTNVLEDSRQVAQGTNSIRILSIVSCLHMQCLRLGLGLQLSSVAARVSRDSRAPVGGDCVSFIVLLRP